MTASKIKIKRINNLTKEILLTLAKVGIFTIAATSPYFLHQVIKKYFKDTSRKRREAKCRRLRELAKRKIISIQESTNGIIRIEFTHQGKKVLRQYSLEEMKLQKPKRWDKKWRMIIYDIPHSQKRARDMFRKKLQQLGLYPLQKSVWVSPHDCLAELEFLCAVFDLALDKDIFCITVPEIPKSEKIKQFFNL